MNRKAILHVQDSQFCYALDENTVELRLRVDKEDVFDSVNVIYGSKYDFYHKQLVSPLAERFCDGNFRWYCCTLKLEDVRFVYVFELVEQGKSYYFSEDGLTESYDFSVSYYNSFQLPFINSADVCKPVSWMKNAVFYEIFIDRFYRGDFSKNDSYINLKWGEIPNPKSFAGGDLDGITDKLDYLRALGVNALYLTPIFASDSNHKYDIHDYFDVDAQFGGKKAFSRLVQEAHKRDMRVVLDAVFNHCSENVAQFKDVLEKGNASDYFDWFIIHGDRAVKGNFECFGVCDYMPKWNTSNPDVQNWLTDVALYWTKEFGVDGWRLDVADEVSHSFWRHFRERIKAQNPDCVILGENWHDSYSFLHGEFDGVMNYSLTKAITDYIVEGTSNAEQFAETLSALYMRNTQTANKQMLNLVDSHDTHRFYTLCGKNIDKLACAVALIFLHTGAPCVYYGTELPLEGGYDPDCRRTMDWSSKGQLTELIASLSRLRARAEVADGQIAFGSNDGLFVLERRAEGTLRLTVNAGSEAKKFLPQGKVLLARNLHGETLKTGFVIEEF